MTFYLLSEGLTCVGIFSGAYESLKVLSRVEKGVDTDILAAVLELWIVLAATAIFEQYIEFFISWFPFYYLFKCVLLGLLLTPTTQFPHLLFEGFIRPAIVTIKLKLDTNVLPIVESLVMKHGHWFNQKLLARSLQLSSKDELLELERNLQDKLTQIRVRCTGFSVVFCLNVGLSSLRTKYVKDRAPPPQRNRRQIMLFSPAILSRFR
ncbi:Receptor expression-enhancing protein 5-like isoform X2 [Phytophthora megakarya]|uniref:Receptor expression-enhancing protein 5-like isoform X2 n=1 Tax=Phytophthora megakarya TaxID=4795 RepID=A0A225WDV8_9STRA|nr:Receptor expression-enhancing protein 5-like isoform X2 [Phytophthora megakarya]